MADAQEQKPTDSTVATPRDNTEQAQALASVKQTLPRNEAPLALNVANLHRLGIDKSYSFNAWWAQDRKEDGVVVYKLQAFYTQGSNEELLMNGL